MIRGNRVSLADYVAELQSKGRIVFDADEPSWMPFSVFRSEGA